ncbi:hypothetical protein ACFWR4_36975 [Streptomyces hydrogenans]|uniref:hypothetical protein n=1 Tax=Streptomyces hydrogenans TaxID=1873719 RepID=UPI003659FE7D
MMDPEVQERISVRRAKLDDLEEQLVKQSAEVRAEREDLAAERVLARMGEQVAAERAATAPTVAQVGGKGVLLIPHRAPEMAETALPPEYQRILASVRAAGGPVMVRQVGRTLGLDTGVRGKLEPLRGKLRKPADRGWLHKRPDGRFTVRP